MKRFLISGALVVASAAPALACNVEMLTVLDWQATKNEPHRLLPYRLEAEVQYNGDKPYRMIHAGVMFADVLGRTVGQVNLPRDQNVAPEEYVLANGQVSVDERIATINPDDITYRTCVWSIVYEDGTVEDFR